MDSATCQISEEPVETTRGTSQCQVNNKIGMAGTGVGGVMSDVLWVTVCDVRCLSGPVSGDCYIGIA